MESLIGQSLGRYRIDSLLGEGGMGAVYKATDVTLQRPVAIKVMHAQFSRQPDFQKRFLNEARTAAKLDHPGIVKVLDFGEAQSRLYIVMEFLPGGNLRQLLQKLKAESQWIVLSEAVPMLRQVCLALDYAHRQGVLHRDIKPDNIMLKPETADGLPYRPVVTDLGLARLVSGEHLTQSNVSMGTPAYMSPEQALGEEIDARSDVYSLGILHYELAVGRLPFPFKSVTEAIRYHSKEAPPPPPAPRRIRPDLLEAVEQVILRALEKDPAARFPTAGKMAEALNALPAEAAARTVMATTTGETAAGVSLVAVLQASTLAEQGESVLAEFPSASSTISQDGISILAPDHSIRRVPMKPDGLTIGRGAGADIALDDERVSRRHARVTFDGVNYQVTDLGSANGTYLADFKLLPGVAQVWTLDKPLRVGGYYLRLEKRQVSGDQTLRSKASVAGTLAQATSSTGRVGVFLEISEFTVEPGSSVVLPSIIINQGEVVDHFSVSVRGIPQEWLLGAAPRVELLPGLLQQTTLTIQPPRTSQSHAGQYPLTLRVVSQDAPDEFAEVSARLTVAAYHQASSQLAPEKVRANKPARVSVRNQGNTPEAFQLTWRDRADEVVFALAQAQLTVAEGQEAVVTFKAKPRRRRWIGGEKSHPFTVQVGSAASEPQFQAGQLISTGLIPTWLPPLMVFLALLLCGVFYALFVKPPVIESVVIDPPNPLPRSPAVLSWQVSNCDRVELQSGATMLARDLPCAGKYLMDQGFVSNSELNLIASNPFAVVVGGATKTVPIVLAPSTLTPTSTPEPGAPVIETFTVDPPTIVAGQSVNITWKVSNAESVELKLGDLVNTVDPSGRFHFSGDAGNLDKDCQLTNGSCSVGFQDGNLYISVSADYIPAPGSNFNLGTSQVESIEQ